MATVSRCSVPDCPSAAKVQGWCRKHYSRFLRYGDPESPVRQYRGGSGTLPERLWSKIERRHGCWEWQGAISKTGYGRIQVDGCTLYAHRAMYELVVEPIEDGLHLDHLCRNRACCNPSHLEPVTCLENVRRGEGNGCRTECPAGHPYDEANTYVYVDRRGYEHRSCRICNRVASRRFYARKAA